MLVLLVQTVHVATEESHCLEPDEAFGVQVLNNIFLVIHGTHALRLFLIQIIQCSAEKA